MPGSSAVQSKNFRYRATLVSESFSAVSAPVQYAAITAFEGSDAIQEYLRNSKIILKAIGQFVHRFLTGLGVTAPEPEGGFYLFPNFEFFRPQLAHKGIFTNTELCEKLLADTGVALLPATAFGRPETELICRLSYVDFDGEKALQALGQSANRQPDIDFIKKCCPNICEAMEAIGNWISQFR